MISYLDDLEAVGVLERGAAALVPGGCLVLKESVANAQRGFFADESDGSLIRTDAQFRQLFQKAKLTLARGERMSGLPQGVFAVHMYALRPQANPQLYRATFKGYRRATILIVSLPIVRIRRFLLAVARYRDKIIAVLFSAVSFIFCGR